MWGPALPSMGYPQTSSLCPPAVTWHKDVTPLLSIPVCAGVLAGRGVPILSPTVTAELVSLQGGARAEVHGQDGPGGGAEDPPHREG